MASEHGDLITDTIGRDTPSSVPLPMLPRTMSGFPGAVRPLEVLRMASRWRHPYRLTTQKPNVRPERCRMVAASLVSAILLEQGLPQHYNVCWLHRRRGHSPPCSVCRSFLGREGLGSAVTTSGGMRRESATSTARRKSVASSFDQITCKNNTSPAPNWRGICGAQH